MIRLALFAGLLSVLVARGEEHAQADDRSPFRTDFANAGLAWKRLQPGQFPPRRSEHRVRGALTMADFIHRRGQFRADGTGALVDFSLTSFAGLRYHGAEADLRDIPLGTALTFFLYQDDKDAFTRAVLAADDFSLLAQRGVTCRLEEARLAEGKLRITGPDGSADPGNPALTELLVNEKTRVWKGAEQVKLADLAVGDELLFDRTGIGPGSPGLCTDLWIGKETHRLASEQQRKMYEAFLRLRGLPGWIDRVEGKDVTVTLFGDPGGLHALFKDDGIDPAKMAKEKRTVEAVVANEELRTYNPPVDKERSVVKDVQSAPTDVYGCSGERWVIEPKLLLEGFRKDRIIRLFASPSWPINDMPFGESVYGEVFAAETIETDPNQYPYRTDFANEDLPWYQLEPGKFPPYQSEHRVSGELVSVDAAERSGQFRADGAPDLMRFSLLPFASVLALNAEGDFSDLVPGAHYLFSLYQDEKGVFSKAAVIADDFSHLQSERYTYRLEALKLDEGKIVVTWELPPVRDGGGNMIKPPPLGRRGLEVGDQTRVWKGDGSAKLSDLAPGDELLVNSAGRTALSNGRCLDIWVGAALHKQVTEQQRARRSASLKEQGIPAWIERIEGNKCVAALFSGMARDDFRALIGEDFRGGQQVRIVPVDDALHPPGGEAAGVLAKVIDFARVPTAAYGCSGVRLTIEAPPGSDLLRKGRLIRISAKSWLSAASGSK